MIESDADLLIHQLTHGEIVDIRQRIEAMWNEEKQGKRVQRLGLTHVWW